MAEADGNDQQNQPYAGVGSTKKQLPALRPATVRNFRPGTADADISAPSLKAWRQSTFSIAEEPYYEVGDNYIYSNGRIETATRVTEKLVHWVVNDGSRYTAANNFVMPPVEWENRSGSVQSSVVSSSNVKWPPARANEVVFVAKPKDPSVSDHLHEAWSGEWTCGTEGQSTVSVPAGKFDVVKIVCERTGGASGQWRRHVWYYSADIRHFVRKEETTTADGQPTYRRSDSRPAWPRYLVPIRAQRF